MNKRIVTLILGASFLTGAIAQVLQVKSIEKVSVPQSEATAEVAGISPAGDYLLLTSPIKTGLVKYDLQSGRSTTLSTAPGAGFEASISRDGTEVLAREISYTDEQLVMRSVNRINTKDGSTEQIVAPTRELGAFAIENTTAVAVADGKLKTRALKGGSASVSRPVVSNTSLRLYLTIDGETKEFAPNGTESQFGDPLAYIWASVSPDGQRVLYHVSELNSTFVANLDGEIQAKLFDLRAPKWLDDNTVVGMRDRDNGEYVTESAIVAATLDGTEQTLTGKETIAMFPFCDAAATKIAFSTPAGEAYIINVSK